MSLVREALLARAFVIIGGLLVAVLMAALLAPLFIDWTSYRADFEREASKILGRPVKVAGEASARILPFPSLSFTNVRVGEDIENPALTIERFSMDAELAPFLSGEVLIFDMRLTKPRGVIIIDEGGRIDWTLRPNSPFDPGNVRIENMVVEDGLFELIDQAASRSHRFALSNAVITAKALTGPWRMQGKAQFDDEDMHLTVSTGEAAEGILPLRVTALPLKRPVVIESDGSAKATNGSVSYAGQFTLRPALKSDYESALVKIPDSVTDNSAAAPFKVTGQFGLAPTGLAVQEFKLETGAKENPYVAKGSGSLIFGVVPMFDLKLDGTQVNFEDDEFQGKGTGLAGRIDIFRQFVSTLPMPTIPGSIDVNLPAIVAGDTTIRDIAFTATPENGAWRVRNFKSTLPGRTQVEADGILKQSEAFGFAGKLLIASTQPAGLADWLTGQVDPAVRKLKAIGFSAHVDLTAEVQSFNDLELALGDALFKGQAQRRNDGERPSLALSLNGGALDLDGLNALGFGFVGENGQARFEGHDVSLNFDAGPVSQSGIVAAQLGLSLRMKADTVEIDRLMLTDIAGVSISATGKIADLAGTATTNIDASMVSADGSGFVTMLSDRFPGNPLLQTLAERVAVVPDLLSDMNATIIASTARDGEARAITVSANAKTRSGEWVLAGNGKGPDLQSATVSFQGSIEQDDPLTLVALAGVPIVPLGAPGPARVEFSGKGDAGNAIDTSVSFSAAQTTGLYKGQIKVEGAGVRVAGTLSLQSEDFDPYLTASGMVFSGVGTGTSVSLNSTLSAENGNLEFTAISGSVADTEVSGDLSVVLKERPLVSGSLKADSIEIAWLAENIYGAGVFDRLSGEAGSTPFVTQPVAPFDGSVAFTVDRLGLGLFGQAEKAGGTLGFSANGVRLENVAGTFLGGTMSGTFDMRNDGGAGTVAGDFSLKDAQASAFGFLTALTGTIDFGGSVTASGKTVDGLTAGLTGSGVTTIREGSVRGFNPDGFAAIAAANANREKAPTVNEVEAMIASSILSASMPLNTDPIAWSVAGGKLRIPGIKGQEGGAHFNVDVNAELSEFKGSAAGSIAYDAGKESVVGAEPVVSFTATVSVDQASFTSDALPLQQYLTQSALEREQARVDALQSALVEKQRLRRDVRLITLLYAERERRAALREEAQRKEAALRGADLAAQWEAEKASLELERKRLEAEARVAAEKAAAEAEKAKLKDVAIPVAPKLPQDNTLDDVFKSLDLQLDLN